MIPFIPISHSEETPVSFLTRLSLKIGHENVVDMLKHCSRIKSYKTLAVTCSRPQEYKSLMSSLGITVNYPQLIFEDPGKGFHYRYFDGFKIINRYFRGDLEAFCPDCLRSEPYWRRRWALRIYTICEKHGCELRDCCEKCNHPLTVERSCIYRCPKCDFNLQKTKSIYAKEATKIIVRKLFSPTINQAEFMLTLNVFASVDKSLKELIPDRQKMDITRLLINRPENAGSELKRILKKIVLRMHPRIQYIALLMNAKTELAIEEALKELNGVDISTTNNWQTVYLTLSETAKVLNVSLQIVQKLIKYKILSVIGKNSCRGIPSNLLIPLLNNSPEELRILIDKATGNEAGLRYVSAAKAAELLRTNESIMWSLVKTNHLKKEIKMVNGYKRNTIDIHSIESFKNKFAMPWSIAEKFGVHKQTISQRLRTLSIYPVSGPSIDGAVTNVFKISDLRKLTKTKVTNAKIHSNRYLNNQKKFKEKNYTSITSVAKELGIGIRAVSKLTWEGVLKRIDPPNRGVLIEIKSVKKLQKKINDPAYMTLIDVRETTGLRPTPFWHYFISTGIIKVIQLFSWQLVSNHSVAKMRLLLSNYVTETQGNQMLGKTFKTLTNLRIAREVEFKKFKGLKSDVYFYSRKSIEGLINSENLTQ